MKHLKIYEFFNTNEIEVNDYVLLNVSEAFASGVSPNKYIYFLENNIGQIVVVNKVNKNVQIKYHNIDFNIEQYFDKDGMIIIHSNYIKYVGKTIEDVMMQYEADKFNL
jgi:hypothetical protein